MTDLNNYYGNPGSSILCCSHVGVFAAVAQSVKQKKLTSYTPLPFTYNVANTVQLMNDLTDIPYDQSLKLASLDISSMYSNIPTKEVLKIIKILCKKNNVDTKTTQDITRIAQTLLGQNYFQFRDTFTYRMKA